MTHNSDMKAGPIWHPFTQHGLYPKMINVTHASGAYLYTGKDTAILDAISSWWVITHGHGHPHIRAAIQTQAEHLDQIIFAGFTHEPAERVAEKLVEITPDGLDYVFFSDSGSTAVEVAIKMALGYWHHQGSPNRHKIIALDDAYHGDTIGAMSLGAPSVFNAQFDPLLFSTERIPSPARNAQATLDALEDKCRHMSSQIAALIVEPLVQGAGGMLIHSASTLAQMREICTRYDILFIADEVMTGWGRTGMRFACEHANIVPDIACYGKGLTGGFLPLAATMCSAQIFDTFKSPDRAKTFFHSSSFTANPVACAAAVANLDVWENEPVGKRIDTISAHHGLKLAKLKENPHFSNIRQIGTIAAFDINVNDNVKSGGYLADIAPALYAFFLKRNILLRPLGTSLYIMPPYCISIEELDEIYHAIEDAGEQFAT